MLAEFSFLRHPLEMIMRFGKIMVPGIERIDIIFWEQNSKQLMARTLTREMNHPFGQTMEINHIKSEMEKHRNRHKKFSWIDRKNLPWSPPKHENIDKSMHDEFESMILIVPVESSEKDSVRDLIFFYFNKNLSNLKLNAQEEVSVDLKDFVGSAYENNVKAMIQAAKEDKDVWEDFAPSFLNIAQTVENLRIENKQIRKMYQERLVASCEYYLQKLSRDYGRQYHYSVGALEQIRKYEGEYHKLENAIRAGVRIANNFNIHNQSENIEIRESHLNFNSTKTNNGLHDMHVKTELEKPFTYLTQLETIAQNLRKNKKPITGKNVAAHIAPPVQAPSITMYLNSNQERILKLFNFYPEKWKLIRTDFKPTANMLENAKNRPHQRS